ncbi:MAG: tRNA (guanosine(46)-N7)-methyltransferase TrmB [Ruminococcaceae bacterium]|nr:tRNA (guanosine(46)-N7)-methyltransferase TrmB [Oscillospiraceae bacterium]
MRMRRKKNLPQRLKACSEYLFSPEHPDLNDAVAINFNAYLDFKEIFKNDNPVMLEIGCGKGQFAVEIAKRNPDINYIAVEKLANVIIVGAEAAQKLELKNLRFLECGAEYLEGYIPEKSIDGIYLNFSCPFPKNTYENRRLTNQKYLKIYKKILKPNAEIHQKTDNMHFFEYSIEEFTKAGFKIKNVSLDLHNSNFEGNIITEYESKFVAKGFPIYRLEAYQKED